MKKTGDKGEIIAIQYLQKHGYAIKDTNFKFGRFGEVDIVAELQGKYVFFEVKYRSHLGYGVPEESLSKSKLHKCLKTVEFYCKKHEISLEHIQFDVIAIIKQNTSHRVTHYRNIEI